MNTYFPSTVTITFSTLFKLFWQFAPHCHQELSLHLLLYLYLLHVMVAVWVSPRVSIGVEIYKQYIKVELKD